MSRSIYMPILVAAFLVAFFMDTSYLNVPGAIVLLSIGILLPIIFVFYKDANSDISRVYFRPIHLFLLSFVIVFFQAPIDILLGYQSGYYMVGRLDLMPESVRVSLIGMIVFLVGYIFKQDDKSQDGSNNVNHMLPAPTTIYKLLTSVMLIVILIFVPKSVLFGGYHTQEVVSSGYKYFASWCGVFYRAFFIQYTINMKLEGSGRGWSIKQLLKDIGWWQNINMMIYLLIILNLGDRGPLIEVIFIYYMVYLMITGICPSKKTLITGMVTGVLMVAFLGYSKKFRDNNSIFERVNATWEANPYEELQESVVPSTYELSTSYKCLPYSIEDMQSSGDYGYGKYQITYILSCVPFVHSFLDLPKPTSDYISHLIQGENLTYGNGSSIIADFYLDGGFIGVMLGMFVFGYFVRQFELVLFANKKSSLFLYCCAFYFSSHFIFVPRSFLLLSLKYSIWLTVIIYLYQRLSNNGVVIKHKETAE